MLRTTLVLLVMASTCVADDAPGGTFPTYTDWPFAADEAARRQQETAKAIGRPVVLQTPLTDDGEAVLRWRLVPAGTFTMGSPREEQGHEADERQHPETIAHPFYMLETQLTVGQYHALLGTEPAEGTLAPEPNLPAGMTYRDTVDKVLPAIAKQVPRGWRVILPDRARLEYAARAGVATMNPGGNTPADADAYAWTRENSKGVVHPVGRKKPNAWGLHDVIGNRLHWYWHAKGRFGDSSEDRHLVYGGSFRTGASRNGARLANVNVSDRAEGARFALVRVTDPLPEGHPETPVGTK